MEHRGPRWPSPQDYNEAVQTASASFADEDLCLSRAEHNLLGLPRATSGSFASVYKMTRGESTFAVRFFLRPISEQSARYAHLSKCILADDLPYTVPFAYIESGVRIRSNWYPLVKMEWVSGLNLDEFVRRNLDSPERLKRLADRFATMCRELRGAGIAHGDLQHGNIIVIAEDELRLVDYDGMFVPDMAGLASTELGHRNYQHPGRSASDFGVYLDNFSALVINASLHALSIDPKLFQQLQAGDECLLFRQRDYLDPLHSPAFHILEAHESEEISRLARIVRWQLTVSPREVLAIEEVPGQLAGLPPLEEARLPGASGLPLHLVAGQHRLPAGEDRRHILFSIRHVVHNEFNHPHCMFGSRQLHNRFCQDLFGREFPGEFFSLILACLAVALAALVIVTPAVFLFGLSILSIFQAIRVIRHYLRLQRAAKRVKHSMPTRVNCVMKMAPPGAFVRKIDYELQILSDPPPVKIAHSTFLGSDPHLLDLFSVNVPVDDYVYVDPKTRTVIARIDDQKIDWLAP